MAQLRVGLIGCGQIATAAHVPALSRLASMVRVTAVCDIRPEAAELTARSFGASWTSNYLELLEDPTIQAVLITTPEFLHREQVVAAANAGKQILCEKPIAATLEDADAMVAVARAAGVRLMIAHSRRFTPRYMRARELLDGGAIGELVMVRENQRRPRAHTSALNAPVGNWSPETGSAKSWYDLPAYSDGVGRGYAIHEMDLIRWYAGAEPRTVFARQKTVQQGREVPDTISIQVTFSNSVLGASDVYTQLPSGYPYYHQLELFGTRGVLRARDTDMIAVTQYDGSGMHFPTSYESLIFTPDAYFTEQRLFFESILHDTPPPLEPHDARAALEMVLAANRAATTGQPVELPLTTADSGR